MGDFIHHEEAAVNKIYLARDILVTLDTTSKVRLDQTR